eukprot:snap_masked-scaffold_18-processed-gene-1.14-mRNA-1 protein AED:1.00 eAED:1.00 QI:0/0/0/0/1/1/2/0/346
MCPSIVNNIKQTVKMCLTVFGETSPVNKLCGNHGSCIENICMCDSGWTNSLDHGFHTSVGPGAEEIFDSLKQNRSRISFDEFFTELTLSAPCTKQIQNNQFRSEKYEVLKILTILCAIVTNILKLIEGNPMFPFSLEVSFGISLNFVLMNATTYFFFVKHTKYNLNKAKALATLRVKFCGFNAEYIFFLQIKFSFVLSVVLFGGCLFIQPLIILSQRNKENMNFSVLESLRYLQIIQNVLGIISSGFIILVCRIVMHALEKDLKLLTDFYITARKQGKDQTSKKSNEVEILLHRIKWTNFLTTQLYLTGLITFFVLLVYPPSEIIMQYMGPFLAGIAVPLVCIVLY